MSIRKDSRIFQGKARKVIGVDVDPAAESNPYIDEFALMPSGHIPVTDRSVDLIIFLMCIPVYCLNYRSVP